MIHQHGRETISTARRSEREREVIADRTATREKFCSSNIDNVFIYDSCNDTVSSSDYTASNDRLINE
jgi:hypothetical protein